MKNKTKNKYNILAIDTSSHICGVSIKKGNAIVSYNEMTGFQHETILFDKIIECLHKAKLDMDDVDLIAISNGPGSYTGLRIGVSCAVGLSIKNNTPIVYIDTLHQLSYNFIGGADYILPIIDAKANRVYTALFDGDTKRITNDEIIDIDTFVDILKRKIIDTEFDKKICILGNGVDVYKRKIDTIAKKCKKIYIAKTDERYNKAYCLCEMAMGIKPLKNIDINYMQVSQAERNMKKC